MRVSGMKINPELEKLYRSRGDWTDDTLLTRFERSVEKFGDREFVVDDPVSSLDVAILQNEVLSPVLNIEDPKTDPRISFVGGIRGLGELVRLVDSGEYEVAFAMYPTSISELFAVADAGMLMPPKSTWFEPKLRSGLFINRF